jgi:hypothetical protein
MKPIVVDEKYLHSLVNIAITFMIGMLTSTIIDYTSVSTSREQTRLWREANWDLIRRTETSLTIAEDSLLACYHK